MARPFRAVLIAGIAIAAAACRAGPWVELAGERYDVEVARTPQEKAVGLMYRQSMPRDHGMIFPYDRPGWRVFTMRNTRIPLDILFFDANHRLVSWIAAEPCTGEPCPVYPGEAPAQYVLELNAGEAERLAVSRGDRLEMHIEPD